MPQQNDFWPLPQAPDNAAPDPQLRGGESLEQILIELTEALRQLKETLEMDRWERLYRRNG